jgi:SAM-dependent methyltransferase
MYREMARFYDLIHDARGRDGGAEAALVLGEIRRRCPSAGTLLDVGCGTGAHLPRFADDLAVAGVDLSPDMLAIAAERCPEAELVEGDFRTFDLGRSFDAVVCLFSGIGYLVEEEDLRAAVRNMARHVSQGGVLAIEGWIEPDHWLGSVVHAESARADGVAVTRAVRSARDGARTDLFMRYVVASSDDIVTIDECHTMRLTVPEEMESAFGAAGLRVERLPHMLHPGRSVYVGSRA